MSEIRAEPGTKSFSWLPVTNRASGEVLSLGLHTVRGAQDGPVLGLFCTSHGDEAYAIQVIRAVVQRVDPQELRGTILGMPVGNPVAFESFTRTTGQGMNTDNSNLNRIFPGSAKGWLTDQIADVISGEFVSHLDFLIDYHCGGSETAISYILLDEREGDVAEKSLELSKLYGTDLLHTQKAAHHGTLTQYAQSQGIPSVIAELGGNATGDPAYLERSVQGVWNIMIHLGMLTGDIVLPEQQYLMNRRVLVRPKNGGLFIPEVGFDKLGKTVPGGTVLARVISPHTFEEFDVFTAPYEETAMIMMRGMLSRVNPGDYAYILGDFASAQIIHNA